jgi:hypothetical protein
VLERPAKLTGDRCLIEFLKPLLVFANDGVTVRLENGVCPKLELDGFA